MVNMVPCLSEMSIKCFCGKDKQTLKDWAQLVSKLTGFTAAVNSFRAVHDGGRGSCMQGRREQETCSCWLYGRQSSAWRWDYSNNCLTEIQMKPFETVRYNMALLLQWVLDSTSPSRDVLLVLHLFGFFLSRTHNSCLCSSQRWCFIFSSFPVKTHCSSYCTSLILERGCAWLHVICLCGVQIHVDLLAGMHILHNRSPLCTIMKAKRHNAYPGTQSK